MSVLASPRDKLDQLPPLPIHRFSVDQYHLMASEGILSNEEPVELLEGLIVIKGCSTMVPAIIVRNHIPANERSFPQVPEVPLAIRRFSVEQYHRMFETGILREEDRVELLEGWIIDKMTRHPPHDLGIVLANGLFSKKLPENWHHRVQLGMATDNSDPEPDIAVVRGQPRDYANQQPRPRDTGLIVEVADSSLTTDRALKGELYARLGIPIYWIVNIPDGQIEVYTDPTGPDPEPAYRHHHDFKPGDQVPLVLDGHEVAKIAVSELLP